MVDEMVSLLAVTMDVSMVVTTAVAKGDKMVV